jgi:hypothetical protein
MTSGATPVRSVADRHIVATLSGRRARATSSRRGRIPPVPAPAPIAGVSPQTPFKAANHSTAQGASKLAPAGWRRHRGVMSAIPNAGVEKKSKAPGHSSGGMVWLFLLAAAVWDSQLRCACLGLGQCLRFECR